MPGIPLWPELNITEQMKNELAIVAVVIGLFALLMELLGFGTFDIFNLWNHH